MRNEFDNTMMSCYHTCRRKYNLSFNRNLVGKTRQAPLEFGSCIHSALDILYQGWDVEKAVTHFVTTYKEDLEQDDKRTLAMGEWIIRNYAAHYADQPWKVVKTEFPFTIDMPHGNKFIGRIDKIIEWDGVLWVVDHKTTSQLGASYFKMAEPNSQFAGYTYAAKKLGFPVVGTVIDAMLVAKGLMKAETRAKLTPLARYDVHYPDEMLEEWLSWAIHTQADIRTDEEMGVWNPNFDACTYYGECRFRRVCKEIPALREKIIDMDYKIEKWDPRKEEV